MYYTTNEAAKKLKITKDALLYYEKEGLLPLIKRDERNRRIYSEADVEWIFFIRCLRDTDMPICKIKEYICLLKDKGGTSIQERKEILLKHEIYVKEKIMTFQRFMALVEKKISYYDELLQSATPDDIKCTDYATEWEHFRKVLEEQKYV